MRVSHYFCNAIHRHDRTFILIEPRQGLCGSVFTNPSADDSIDFINMSNTRAIILKARVINQVWLTDCGKYTASQCMSVSGKGEPLPIFRLVDITWGTY